MSAPIPDINPEPETWFRNYYRCHRCAFDWDNEDDCTCNDRCPRCNAEIEPHESEDVGE